MDSFVLTFVILLLLFFLFSDQVFFDTLYNSILGRLVIIILLITMSIINIWLSFLFLMIVIYYSQINAPPSIPPENFDNIDRVNISDVLNNNFLYKNYKTESSYKKTKREGMKSSIIKENEKLKSEPKTSIVSKPTNIVPFSKSSYFNL